MSNKAPAFQLYAQDFLTGVMDLTMEERGVYITLLCKQWSLYNEIGIPKKRLRLFLGYDWENLPEMVKKKFIDNGDYFFNERLNDTIIERIAFIKKQTINGEKGGRPPKSKTQTKAIITPSMKMKKKIEDKEEKEIVVYPYTSKEFINTWSNWKIYKSNEFKFNYRTIQSEQAALKKLSNESDNEAHAVESIESAMANGWKGIYPQKIITNGKQSSKNELSYSKEFQEELIRKISS
jgi:uncharacterized protein YdaU (DUF1376 family)